MFTPLLPQIRSIAPQTSHSPGPLKSQVLQSSAQGRQTNESGSWSPATGTMQVRHHSRAENFRRPHIWRHSVWEASVPSPWNLHAKHWFTAFLSGMFLVKCLYLERAYLPSAFMLEGENLVYMAWYLLDYILVRWQVFLPWCFNLHLHMHKIYIYVYSYIYIYIYMYINLYIHLCLINMFICLYIYLVIYLYFKSILLYLCLCIYIYLSYIYIDISVYRFIFIYILQFLYIYFYYIFIHVAYLLILHIYSNYIFIDIKYLLILYIYLCYIFISITYLFLLYILIVLYLQI